MKKTIFKILLIICGVFLLTNISLAADQSCVTGLGGECKVTCDTVSEENKTATPPCETTKPMCCVKKETSVNNGNQNTGLGFDKVPGVAQRAGYGAQERTIDQIISTVISVVLSLLGVIFMVLMVYGGYTWMTAQGDEQKVDKAKDIIRAAVIGIIVVAAAYAISIFVITRIWPSQ